MPTLSNSRIASVLAPFYAKPTDLLLTQLSQYLDLLLKWNAHTNLTAIRDPEEIVRRHFGESLFVVNHLPFCATLLDLGSGAGFPGLPIQLALPDLKVTLTESQNKKASFLSEVVRCLSLETKVWAARAEMLPASRLFDVVTLRAVDNPQLALKLAAQRLVPGGTIAHLTSSGTVGGIEIAIPGSDRALLHLMRPGQDES